MSDFPEFHGKGLYVAVFAREKDKGHSVLAKAFNFPGHEHESAHGYAVRVLEFKDEELKVVLPAHIFGNKMQKTIGSMSVNKGCTERET